MRGSVTCVLMERDLEQRLLVGRSWLYVFFNRAAAQVGREAGVEMQFYALSKPVAKQLRGRKGPGSGT